MAYFAKITEDNRVLTLLTLTDTDTQNNEGVETESVGQAYLEKHNNWPAHLWIQTSYNTRFNTHLLGGTPFRGNLATTGAEWDPVNNIFWPIKHFSNWVKYLPEARWQSPIGDAPELTEEQNSDINNVYIYKWNEDNNTWVLFKDPAVS